MNPTPTLPQRFGWVISFPRFRWVIFWIVASITTFIVASMMRRQINPSAAAQLKDNTDTPALRWMIGNDPLGYVTGIVLFVAVFITAKWVVHFVIALSKGTSSKSNTQQS